MYFNTLCPVFQPEAYNFYCPFNHIFFSLYCGITPGGRPEKGPAFKPEQSQTVHRGAAGGLRLRPSMSTSTGTVLIDTQRLSLSHG